MQKMSSTADTQLSEQQLALIERNRQKALSLRANRLATHPYKNDASTADEKQPMKP